MVGVARGGGKETWVPDGAFPPPSAFGIARSDHFFLEPWAQDLRKLRRHRHVSGLKSRCGVPPELSDPPPQHFEKKTPASRGVDSIRLSEIRHSSFIIDSSFGFRHSSFPESLHLHDRLNHTGLRVQHVGSAGTPADHCLTCSETVRRSTSGPYKTHTTALRHHIRSSQ